MDIKKLVVCIVCMYSSVSAAGITTIDIEKDDWFVVCISGVKYFSRFGKTFTPYYKPDGSLYTCTIKTN